jgi:hypothetical protein
LPYQKAHRGVRGPFHAVGARAAFYGSEGQRFESSRARCLTQQIVRMFGSRPEGTVVIAFDVTRRFASVDLADLGEVAAKVLLEEGHEHSSYARACARALAGRTVRAFPGAGSARGAAGTFGEAGGLAPPARTSSVTCGVSIRYLQDPTG